MQKLGNELNQLIDKIAGLARTSIMDGEKDNNLLFSKVQKKVLTCSLWKLTIL